MPLYSHFTVSTMTCKDVHSAPWSSDHWRATGSAFWARYSGAQGPAPFGAGGPVQRQSWRHRRERPVPGVPAARRGRCGKGTLLVWSYTRARPLCRVDRYSGTIELNTSGIKGRCALGTQRSISGGGTSTNPAARVYGSGTWGRAPVEASGARAAAGHEGGRPGGAGWPEAVGQLQSGPAGPHRPRVRHRTMPWLPRAMRSP